MNDSPKLKIVSSNSNEGDLDSDEDIRLLQRLRRERTEDLSFEDITKADVPRYNMKDRGTVFAALVAIGAIVKGLLELYSALGW
jgi:hypothetical protein